MIAQNQPSSRPIGLLMEWTTYLCSPITVPIHPKHFKLLKKSGNCPFQLTLAGPSLRPVLFGSRSNLPYAIDYHSFMGEIACGRWSIACSRRYLFWIKNSTGSVIVIQLKKF